MSNIIPRGNETGNARNLLEKSIVTIRESQSLFELNGLEGYSKALDVVIDRLKELIELSKFTSQAIDSGRLDRP